MALIPRGGIFTRNDNSSFVATAVPSYRNLGQTSVALGQSSRVKLDPIGLITSLFVEVNLTITIGVASAIISPMAPYNIMRNVKLSDEAGNDRVNCPGQHLWALNSIRKRSLEYSDTGVFYSSPFVPTSIGTHTLSFYLDVPLAFSDTDLRGSLRGDVAGDIYLTIDWDDVLIDSGNADRVYTGASNSTVTLNSGYITVFQKYLSSTSSLPAEIQIPHYIEGGIRITDGIVNMSERLINYPVNRKCVGVVLTYINAGSMSTSDVSQLRVVSGPSEIFRFTAGAMYARQRDMLGGNSLPPNFFAWTHDLPFETKFSRANQIGMTPASAGVGNTYIGAAFESFA